MKEALGKSLEALVQPLVMVAFLPRESGDVGHHLPVMTVPLSEFAELSVHYGTAEARHDLSPYLGGVCALPSMAD
jgi:hypothetical protein